MRKFFIDLNQKSDYFFDSSISFPKVKTPFNRETTTNVSMVMKVKVKH